MRIITDSAADMPAEEAEQLGAREKAETFYERGLTLETQASSLWERAAYPQARQCYDEARASFAAAGEHARQQLQKEKVQTIRRQIAVEREAARREDAEEFVPLIFPEITVAVFPGIFKLVVLLWHIFEKRVVFPTFMLPAIAMAGLLPEWSS